MSNAICDVVIVTHNSEREIVACIESVYAASAQPLNVVVVDNASSDRTVDLIARTFPHVRLIANTTNRFYAAAGNQGAECAAGEFLVLLNPDTVLPVGGIDALFRRLKHDTGLAAVAPMLIGPDGKRQLSLRELPRLDTLWYDLLGLSLVFHGSETFGRWRMGYFDGRTSRPVEQPMASCLMIRRSVWQEVGPFDESYPMFFNDVDWCRRLKEHGGKILYAPDIAVRHVGGASINRRKVRMIWMGHAAYLRYLDRLYRPYPHWRLLVWMSAPLVWLAAAVRSIWWSVKRAG